MRFPHFFCEHAVHPAQRRRSTTLRDVRSYPFTEAV